ncbi:WhiB family transcriptional regulator [Novosphingobium sp.]|uniref:WhiB family transcriptional regulator n=1 Tax=Novosphingobium sp. TaxID=1874826 RepID=UPI003D6D8289
MRYQHPEPNWEPDWSRSIGSLPAWRVKAACLDMDPELFFPLGSTGRALEQIEEAKAICSTCPVITECLGWALDTGQHDGVWGGKSEDERKTERRRRCRRRSG